MAHAQREFKVEVRAIPVPNDEMAEMIIRALFGCSPSEAAKICIDEMRKLQDQEKDKGLGGGA